MKYLQVAVGNVHLDLGAGRRGVDMGPSAIHLAGLVKEVRGLGHEVVQNFEVLVSSPEVVEVGDPSVRFLPTILDATRRLADRVEAALDKGHFPLVLGGDHSVAIGTVSGMARHFRKRGLSLGVIWVDAHTDMNTPSTSPSGNIHGMPLAVLLGHGHPDLVALAGDRPALDPELVCVIGARDIDAREREVIRETGVRVYTMSELDDRGTAVCVREAIERVSKATAGIHLSLDLDGVDPDHAPGVGTPVPGGLDLRESHLICEKLAQTQRLVGLEIVELNPILDTSNRTGRLAVWLALSALGKSIL
ncbi:MAG: arginase [Deltaproteobacteria bacterium]|jgi:arginase|nr:arginase [Deltaproteobacteria bacterium]